MRHVYSTYSQCNDAYDGVSMTREFLTRRSVLTAAGTAGMGFALAGCGAVANYPDSWNDISTGNGEPNRGGVLHYGLSTEPVNFEPHVSSGAASDVIRQMLYNGLLQYDPDGEIVPDLALEHGWAGDTAYRVKIRTDVRFHDGSKMTASDVVFSMRRIIDPDTSSTAAPLFRSVERVDASSSDTIVFTLREPDRAFPFALADPCANVISKQWIESGADPLLEVMGTGPFTFVERVPGVSIVIERFDDYFVPELPYLNAIEFTPMEDDYARVTALRTATVDMIDYIPSTHVDVIENNSQLEVYSDSVFGFGVLGFVTSRPPFDDKRVRQAVACSIDRDAALETAFLGHGRPITGGLVPDEVAPYASQLEGAVEYDPERASHLLRKAGRDDLDLSIITTSSYSVISRPAEAMLPSLQESVVNPRLTRQEWLSFQETVEAKKYPSFAWGTSLKFGHPAALSEVVASGSRWAKFMDFNDKRTDDLLAEARRSKNTSLSNELFMEVEKRVLDEMPLTYTLRRIQGEASHKYVRGFSHPPKGAWTQVSLRGVWLEEER